MTVSWYSISISLPSNTAILNGYFIVDNSSNLVAAFYETINGTTNLNNNILIPTGEGNLQSDKYLDFNVYSISGFAVYDNAFLPNWLKFDVFGVVLNTISAYPQYNRINLFANEFGNESTNTIGSLKLPTEIISILFKITPISDPSVKKNLSGNNGLTSTPTASVGNFFALNRLSGVKGNNNKTYGDSSLRTARLTAVAVGKTNKTNYSDGAASTNQGIPAGNHTTTARALNRVRNASCVAPKKKTSNVFQSGGSTFTGSGNRQLF